MSKALIVIVAAALLIGFGALHGSHPKPRPLAGLRWTDQTPSWSPDGRRIVFASNRAHPESGIDQLYLMNADGSHVRRLTWDGEDAREPSFSPGGKRIVYAGNVLDSSRDYTDASGIFTTSATGADVRFLTPGLPGAADQPAWSPDGRWIAFIDTVSTDSGSSSRSDLYVVRPNGSSLHRLAINIDDWSQALTWSPDSKEIAVMGADERLYRIHIDTGKPTRVTGSTFGVVTTDLAWSPDSSTIAYVRGRISVSSCFCSADGADVDPRHLWILDLGTGRRHRVRSVIDSRSVDSFATTIAWLRGRTPTLAVFDGDGIRLVDANGRSHGSLKTSNWGQLAVGSGSPGGNKLLVVDGPSDSYESAIFVARIGARRVLPLTQREAPR